MLGLIFSLIFFIIGFIDLFTVTHRSEGIMLLLVSALYYIGAVAWQIVHYIHISKREENKNES